MLVQKLQAEIDSRREQTDSLLGPIRQAVNYDYYQARQYNDMVAASLERIKGVTERQSLLVANLQHEKELEKSRLEKDTEKANDKGAEQVEQESTLQSPSVAKLTKSTSETLSVSPAPPSSLDRLNPVQRPPTTHRTRTSRQRRGL